MDADGAVPSPGSAAAPTPSRLCDVHALGGADPAKAGAVWKLTESGRQLDANLVQLPAHQCVGTHAEPDLDVLLLVVSGHGTLGTGDGTEPLTGGVLFWLPHGSTRRITAGADGLSYLTVHRRRPGMQIRSRLATDV
ncbi:cupin domain-containing protein [Streptomyces sp. CWNU-52B]|uniref:cupin domain-containing protein n=1 Tax=unclassified Streptomyces TaxID=2593676 RepID=UPI0039C20271